MCNLKFYRDEDGQVRAQGEDESLAIFLETDVQSSREICEELLRLLDDKQTHSEFSGNAHHLTISSTMVRIESTGDPHAQERRLPRAEFRQAIRAWSLYIKR